MPQLPPQDPAKAIPRGTLLAIGITYVTYMVYPFIIAATCVRGATGVYAVVTYMPVFFRYVHWCVFFLCVHVIRYVCIVFLRNMPLVFFPCVHAIRYFLTCVFFRCVHVIRYMCIILLCSVYFGDTTIRPRTNRPRKK